MYLTRCVDLASGRVLVAGEEKKSSPGSFSALPLAKGEPIYTSVINIFKRGNWQELLFGELSF